MKSDRIFRQLLIIFVVAGLGYAVLFQVLERRRAAKGPWQVTFSQTAEGDAAVLINQPRLGITNVSIYFIDPVGQFGLSPKENAQAQATASTLATPKQSEGRSSNQLESAQADAGATNVLWRFDQARAVPFDVPFGKVVFLDTTFLPGTVVLRLFGHEVQLLPRVLTIDGTEHPWRSGMKIELTRAPTG